MVVWLDELQRYLDGEHGLTGGVVRALLNAPRPVVVIGTLWPDWYTVYTALPVPGGADLHAREREVLDLAAIVRLSPEFSPAEQDRARAAAARDRRLAVALNTAGYGLTQTLAPAPQLVARWEDAQTASPYAWAVLTAALDATRLGARTPLSADLLRAAAPGYCTSQQQAEAPENWFEKALAYATGKLHGAVATLSPAGADMGQVAGYIAADYLIQHASRKRRSARVPADTWDAILSHVRDPADAARLAGSAENRLLYRYAIPLYHHAADADNEYAAQQLAVLLAKRGDLDGAERILRARADVGHEYAASQLADLLAKRGDVDGLRARADSGDVDAAQRLDLLLAEHGDVDGLRARADSGDWHAAERLADLLAKRGDLDGLRAQADAENEYAALRLADLLADRGDLDGAERILRPLADNPDDGFRIAGVHIDTVGDKPAARRLAGLLAERGDLNGLRAQADAGDKDAALLLADLLVEHGDLNGLRAQADAGDKDAALLLADLLVEHGDLDEAERILRARADDLHDGFVMVIDADSERPAARRLNDLLAQCGDLNGLRARADAGDKGAGELLGELLVRQGRIEEAERLRQFGLNPDGSIAYA